MSFKINNTTVSNIKSFLTFDDGVVTFPGLINADAHVDTPLENFYCERMPLILEEGAQNIELNCESDGLVCCTKGNLQITWTLNVTVPDASTSNPKYFGPKITHRECGDSSYAYNLFKVKSSEPQEFQFVNHIQNTTGDLKIYFGMFSPTGCEPNYTLNESIINVVAINSLKSDGGRDRR